MAINVTVDNPDHLHRTPPLVIATTSDIGAVDDTWKNQGAVLNVDGYNYMLVYITMTVNDSTGNQLQVLVGDTNSTATYVLPSASSYLVSLGDLDITDGIAYQFNLANLVKYVQFKTKATVVGATEGTVTIHVTLGY